MEQYADMVKIHYEYFKNNKKYKKHIPSSFKELEKYSDKNSMVFETNDEIVVAMRGLQPGKSIDDVMIGAEIFLEDAYQQSGSDFDTSTAKKKGISLLPNKYGEILKKEQSKIEELKKEYPNKKIVLSGHSRGGRKAIDLGEKNKLEYHAFQPAEMNRMANPLLSIGTNMIAPMGGRIQGNIDKSLWDMYSRGLPIGETTIGNEMIHEFLDLKEIQKNVISAAASSSDYQTATQNFLGKTLIPRVVERSLDLAAGKDALRLPSNVRNLRPEILKRVLEKEFGTKSVRLDGLPDESFFKKNVDSVMTLFTDKGKEKRKAPNGGISNVYKTSNDVISRGYEHTKLIQPKPYAYDMFDHYFLGDHTIDHFISKEMFDSVNENKPIEGVEEVKSDDLEENFSPLPDITQPSPSIGYSVNNRELCKKYGSVYNVHCNKLLR